MQDQIPTRTTIKTVWRASHSSYCSCNNGSSCWTASAGADADAPSQVSLTDAPTSTHQTIAHTEISEDEQNLLNEETESMDSQDSLLSFDNKKQYYEAFGFHSHSNETSRTPFKPCFNINKDFEHLNNNNNKFALLTPISSTMKQLNIDCDKKNKSAYKHVPHKDRPPLIVARRNARERRRVQAVNSAFVRLRKIVPIFNSRGKRISKVKTLQTAIDYINGLEALLKETDMYRNLDTISEYRYHGTENFLHLQDFEDEF